MSALMQSVKKGSGEYRRIIMRGRKQITLHPPGPWRKKLSDDSITNSDIRQMKINLHSTYLPSDQLDKLCRLKLGKTQFGMSSVHAGTANDPWCKKCINRAQYEVEKTILHWQFTLCIFNWEHPPLAHILHL